MNTEEKAKAYDEALEKARQLCAYPTTKPFISDLQDLFPELKENEGERIRKKIIATIHLYYGEPLEDEAKEMIFWLEKQCEQNHVWSREDEKCIRLSTDIIDSSLRAGLCVQLDRDRCVDWFKSLKDLITGSRVTSI